jgi:hypothetical protein
MPYEMSMTPVVLSNENEVFLNFVLRREIRTLSPVQVRTQPTGVKPKMTGRKLRSITHFQGALKQTGVKQGCL